ncbi:hypothetical protein E1301_Tti019184 [Triplophysa tibetana]|uniref:Uncharacterized protein n=1 Tax=Triplophysa tibetana TaxID=1572043 RepID=A0A5A9P486_9TELE|nr:hypothetical protein E1301_Tti019184 [Triplophysa tibetana]
MQDPDISDTLEATTEENEEALSSISMTTVQFNSFINCCCPLNRPSSDIKKGLAMAFVYEFPCLKDSTSSGYGAWYTPGRMHRLATEFLEEHLRNVRKLLRKLKQPGKLKPQEEHAVSKPQSGLPPERIQEMVDCMKVHKYPVSEVEGYMKDTAIYRGEWIRSNESKSIPEILTEFPRLLDNPGIEAEADRKLFEDWATIADRNRAQRDEKVHSELADMTPGPALSQFDRYDTVALECNAAFLKAITEEGHTARSMAEYKRMQTRLMRSSKLSIFQLWDWVPGRMPALRVEIKKTTPHARILKNTADAGRNTSDDTAPYRAFCSLQTDYFSFIFKSGNIVVPFMCCFHLRKTMQAQSCSNPSPFRDGRKYALRYQIFDTSNKAHSSGLQSRRFESREVCVKRVSECLQLIKRSESGEQKKKENKRQWQDESFKTMLRLRELNCRLRQHSPEGAPVGEQIMEQLLLGFLLIHDIECMGLPSYLDAEEHVKGKVSLLIVGPSPNTDLRAANGLEIPYIGYALVDFTVAAMLLPDPSRKHDFFRECAKQKRLTGKRPCKENGILTVRLGINPATLAQRSSNAGHCFSNCPYSPPDC